MPLNAGLARHPAQFDMQSTDSLANSSKDLARIMLYGHCWPIRWGVNQLEAHKRCGRGW
jgi:hypothetical protein